MKRIGLIFIMFFVFMVDVRAAVSLEEIEKVSKTIAVEYKNASGSNSSQAKNPNFGLTDCVDSYSRSSSSVRPSTDIIEEEFSSQIKLPFKTVVLVDDSGSLRHANGSIVSKELKLDMMNNTIKRVFDLIGNLNIGTVNAPTTDFCTFNNLGSCSSIANPSAATAPSVSTDEAKGSTNIQAALLKAKELLINSGLGMNGSSCSSSLPLIVLLTDGYMNEVSISSSGNYSDFRVSSPASNFYYTLSTMLEVKGSLCSGTKLVVLPVGMSNSDPVLNYFTNPTVDNYNALDSSNEWTVGSPLKQILGTNVGSNYSGKQIIASLDGAAEYGIFSGTIGETTSNKKTKNTSNDKKKKMAVVTVEGFKLNESFVKGWDSYQLDGKDRRAFTVYVPYNKNKITGEDNKEFLLKYIDQINVQINGKYEQLNYEDWDNGNRNCDKDKDPNCKYYLNVFTYNGIKYVKVDFYYNAINGSSNDKIKGKADKITGIKIRFDLGLDMFDSTDTSITVNYNYNSFNGLVDFSTNLFDSNSINNLNSLQIENGTTSVVEKISTTMQKRIHTNAIEKNVKVDLYLKTNEVLYPQNLDGSRGFGTTCNKVSINVPVLVTEDLDFKIGEMSSNIYAGGGFVWKNTTAINSFKWYYQNYAAYKLNSLGEAIPNGYPIVTVNHYNKLLRNGGGLASLENSYILLDSNDNNYRNILNNLYTDSGCTNFVGDVNGYIEQKVSELLKTNVIKDINYGGFFKSVDSNNPANLSANMAVNDVKSNNENEVSFWRNADSGIGSMIYTKSYIFGLKNSYINSQTGKVQYSDTAVSGSDYAGVYHYIPINYKDSVVRVHTNGNFSSIDGIKIAVENFCPVSVNHLIVESPGEVKVKYRSIDVKNPFPKANVNNKASYPVNWQDWYCGTGTGCNVSNSNKNRIASSYSNYSSKPLYKISFKATDINEIKDSSVSYTSWSNIDKNGVSSFVNSRFILNNSGSFCKLGEAVNSNCDRYG